MTKKRVPNLLVLALLSQMECTLQVDAAPKPQAIAEVPKYVVPAPGGRHVSMFQFEIDPEERNVSRVNPQTVAPNTIAWDNGADEVNVEGRRWAMNVTQTAMAEERRAQASVEMAGSEQIPLGTFRGWWDDATPMRMGKWPNGRVWVVVGFIQHD